jgi:hypothetical protein
MKSARPPHRTIPLTMRSVAQLASAMTLLAASSGPTHANTSCLDRLLASLEAPTDVSACNLLGLTDGRVVAVRTQHGLFVQTKDGATSTHYFINAKRRQIEASHFVRRHTYPPMDRAQPDAKQYYYPFYGAHRGGGMAIAPKSMNFVCVDTTAFVPERTEVCPGWR